jgi:hypothetical protein
MTIHNDYASTADFVAGWAIRREPMPPQTCAHLAQVLMDLAERVGRIEEIPMRLDSPEVRLGFHRMYEADDAD